ncbi:MAG: PDZ domain-containing protein, partial [Halobacteria archaeon]|nr:PDZ domain-containing protein [Halobacteria archaeon]
GIVSGVNRSMLTTRGFAIPDTVQTDAPVNPGNSGGPLVNMNGKVVGVNRAKQGDNIGFAISPDLVQKVVPKLIKQGYVDHSYLGITTRDVTPSVAQANNLGRPRGVIVVDVRQGDPSDGVLQGSNSQTTVNGIQVPVGGDIIISIEGTSINSNEELAGYLMTHTQPGETIDITVLRDGETQTVQVTLGERPAPPQ